MDPAGTDDKFGFTNTSTDPPSGLLPRQTGARHWEDATFPPLPKRCEPGVLVCDEAIPALPPPTQPSPQGRVGEPQNFSTQGRSSTSRDQALRGWRRVS